MGSFSLKILLSDYHEHIQAKSILYSPQNGMWCGKKDCFKYPKKVHTPLRWEGGPYPKTLCSPIHSESVDF